MNYKEIIMEYILKCGVNEPIFYNEIIDYIIKYIDEKKTQKLYNKVKEIMYRLVKDKAICSEYKGIYYIPKKNIFGTMSLPKDKIIKYKYLMTKDDKIKGYITGAKLFNDAGLTTQVPNTIDIVTNEYTNKNKYYDKAFNVVIRKSNIKIDIDNYKYLQLIDILLNKDKINIEVENDIQVIYNFIKNNKLDFEKILKYVKLTNNTKIINKVLLLAR